MSSLFTVSERSHAGFLCMSKLARMHPSEEYCSLQEISDELNVSLAYLEEIAMRLKRADLVQARKGPQGGYRLSRSPQDITAEMMLVALEGPLHLVQCQDPTQTCPVQDRCQNRGFWGKLRTTIHDTLQSTTLAQLLTL